MPEIALEPSHHKTFRQNGFVIVRNVLSHNEIDAARSRFEPLFRGEFETGVAPDEWNWREGRDDPSLTRQICNGWRADKTIASIVLRDDIGRACAQLRGWAGARINQDNVIWKPPATKPLGFHQDESYQHWNIPGEMMTCWITLDDASSSGGTIEYVRGSHLWPLSGQIEQFHAPDDPAADLRAAAKAAGIEPEFVPIEVTAGDAVIHHGRTWHGSRSNRGTTPRRSVIAHCMDANSRYHPVNDHPIYGQHRQAGSDIMPDDIFPILYAR